MNEIQWDTPVLLWESVWSCFLPKVNNPVSVLTQEMSKYFLHSKGEGDKYKVILYDYIFNDNV